MASLTLAHYACAQTLGRVTEPEQLTTSDGDVTDYTQAMKTKMPLFYAIGLQIINRARNEHSNQSAVDLACGPGHFTTSLARHLGYQSVTGLDLSNPMVQVATQSLTTSGFDNCVNYRVQDITKLDQDTFGPYDLCSFTGAAHHMPDLDTVKKVVAQMELITKPQGLIMIMDMVRLKTKNISDRYIEALGSAYLKLGLPHFLKDFQNSQYAAWTPTEFEQIIPQQRTRCWYHLVPIGLPSVQIVLGLPLGQTKVIQRKGFSPKHHPLIEEASAIWLRDVGKDWATENLSDWNIMQTTLNFGSKKAFPANQ